MSTRTYQEILSELFKQNGLNGEVEVIVNKEDFLINVKYTSKYCKFHKTINAHDLIQGGSWLNILGTSLNDIKRFEREEKIKYLLNG